MRYTTKRNGKNVIPMSILIKGMEMPKNCDSCPCYYETEGAWRNECEVLLRERDITDERPNWCPLVPVPEHGRLIDADALLKDITPTDEDEDNGAKLLMNVFCQVVKTRPTIIPAEEGE